jgi:hypothetical protein
MKYKQGRKKWKISGKLTRTKRTVKPVGSSKRTIMKDEHGKLWVKVFGKYWKFPEEIEY